MAKNNAGGYFNFGPTFDSTMYVRAAIEGSINGFYDVNATVAEGVKGETAGRFAAIDENGTVVLAGAKGVGAIGLIREDLKDMINASGKASFYFIGGEYHVAESRLGATIDKFKAGMSITSDANGQIVPAVDGDRVLGTVVAVGEYRQGNMKEWAGTAANGGMFLGFIMHV